MMKYLVEWEYDTEKVDETIKLNMEYMKAYEIHPEKFYEYVFPPHYIGNGKGVSVVEITAPAQMINAQIFLERGFKMKFTPITDITDQISTYLSQK